MAENSEKALQKFQFKTRTGEMISLTKEVVKKYITNNVDITDQEFAMFFTLCKVNGVNPFLKEAYIIKYGSTPATIVLDYKVLQQIAEDNKFYKGMSHGVVVKNLKGELEERKGEYCLEGESLVAGWCEVFRSDRQAPTRVVAQFDEFKGLTKEGNLNTNWKNKPCFMICKVAKAQALREAFPNLVGSNIYTKDEMDSVQAPTFAENTNDKKTTIKNTLQDENVVDAKVEEETPTSKPLF